MEPSPLKGKKEVKPDIIAILSASYEANFVMSQFVVVRIVIVVVVDVKGVRKAGSGGGYDDEASQCGALRLAHPPPTNIDQTLSLST